MTDPIPTDLITLPEALQKIAGCLSEAHLETHRATFIENLRSLGKIDDHEMWTPKTSPEAISAEEDNGPGYPRLSAVALYEWQRRELAFIKLNLALQTGAITAMVLSALSNERFRLAASDWCLEPFREEIIRGGRIPSNRVNGFRAHEGRTVFLDMTRFEEWLATNQKSWKASSGEELCLRWLIQEMRANPHDKQQGKNAWFEQARSKYAVARREFDRAWLQATRTTGCSWNRPGAPRKSSQ